jgi:hypothetical protein
MEGRSEGKRVGSADGLLEDDGAVEGRSEGKSVGSAEGLWEDDGEVLGDGT